MSLFAHRGTERNWKIVGLTPDNFVLVDGLGGLRNSNERPSEYLGIEYLTRVECGILRRGVTAGGRDREAPK
jgi:hypothetical protein